jgi:DNA-binding XRE family transcriptional regulator
MVWSKQFRFMHVKPEAVEEFRRKLKDFRRVHRLTQPELAAALGVTRDVVAGLEYGWMEPQTRTMMRLERLERQAEREKEREVEELGGLS